MEVTSDLLEMRKTQAWSLIKVTNHRFPEEVVNLDDPQTLLWIRAKGWVGLA